MADRKIARKALRTYLRRSGDGSLDTKAGKDASAWVRTFSKRLGRKG